MSGIAKRGKERNIAESPVASLLGMTPRHVLFLFGTSLAVFGGAIAEGKRMSSSSSTATSATHVVSMLLGLFADADDYEVNVILDRPDHLPPDTEYRPERSDAPCLATMSCGCLLCQMCHEFTYRS